MLVRNMCHETLLNNFEKTSDFPPRTAHLSRYIPFHQLWWCARNRSWRDKIGTPGQSGRSYTKGLSNLNPVNCIEEQSVQSSEEYIWSRLKEKMAIRTLTTSQEAARKQCWSRDAVRNRECQSPVVKCAINGNRYCMTRKKWKSMCSKESGNDCGHSCRLL